MAMAVGRGWAYYIVSITITVVLALAANTSFGGLPVLASLVARDNYLPHLFSIRGDRQTFGNGIVVLTVLAGALLVAVDGNTNELIPLFAIGVFIGFTLSQAGLVVHWWRERPPRWRRRAAINGFGACVTAIATVVFLVSKFTEGAWVVVIAIPAFIVLFLRIHAYYERAAKDLRFDENPGTARAEAHHRGRPGQSDLAAHRAGAQRGRVPRAGGDRRERRPRGRRRRRRLRGAPFDDWERWNCGIPLKLLHTDYASVVQPIVAFIDQLRADHPDDQFVVLIPVIRPEKFRYRILHNQLDLVLSSALRTATTSSWPGSRCRWCLRRTSTDSRPAEAESQPQSESQPEPESGAAKP